MRRVIVGATDLVPRVGRGAIDVVAASVLVPVLMVQHQLNRRRRQSATSLVRWAGTKGLGRPHGRPEAVGLAVGRASRLAGMDAEGCLARAQVIWLLLRWSGYRPQLWLGAQQKLSAGGVAHAWVELDGTVIGDSSDIAERYPPFDRPLFA